MLHIQGRTCKLCAGTATNMLVVMFCVLLLLHMQHRTSRICAGTDCMVIDRQHSSFQLYIW